MAMSDICTVFPNDSGGLCNLLPIAFVYLFGIAVAPNHIYYHNISDYSMILA